jgi:uncharacterized membrane protein YccC
MVQRSLERLLGTWAGLLLAGAILILHPQGLWLALTVMALQFTIEMLVLRNYALAAIFITGAALTIASGGQAVTAPGHYLLARGVDTLVGCVIALVVFWLIPPRAAQRHLPEQIVATLRSVRALMPHAASGNVITNAARSARRDVQRNSLALTNAYEESLVASSSERRNAERLWPAIAAVERLAYRTLSICWALERLGGEPARSAALSMFGENGALRVSAAIEALIDSIADGRTPPAITDVPRLLEKELVGVHLSLQALEAAVAHPYR